MITSQVGNVMDALVAACTEAVDVPVYDGPIATNDFAKAFIVIGSTDVDEEADWVAATADQGWAALGARSKDEQGDIYGVSVAWTGETGNARPARATALANVALIEEALRASPQLGLGPSVNWLAISVTQVRQILDGTGLGVWVSFTVRFKARLSGT